MGSATASTKGGFQIVNGVNVCSISLRRRSCCTSMELYSLSFCSTLKPPLINSNSNSSRSKKKSQQPVMEVSAFSYQKFVHFAMDEAKRRTHLLPSPLQENFSSMKAMDSTTELHMLSFQAPKIRLLRSMSIEGSQAMQVLDFAVFPKPEYDLPIFCANFFTASTTNIIVLDLNPLHNVISRRDYKDKYYKSLMPLGLKYAELLPWGGKLTSESLRFFSPIVIWTKFTSTPYMQDVLYSAFKDYYMAWLELLDLAEEETDASQIICNREAQHKYLTWRAQKDPGHHILKKLIGETLAKDMLRGFLFNGINELGSKTFLDYFPEYQCENGTINEKRSIIGKSYENRPWDARGEFIGDTLRVLILVWEDGAISRALKNTVIFRRIVLKGCPKSSLIITSNSNR